MRPGVAEFLEMVLKSGSKCPNATTRHLARTSPTPRDLSL